jgi:hypothetical protein
VSAAKATERPLTRPGELAAMVADLIALCRELTRDDAPDTQRRMGEALGIGHSATASGSGQGGNSSGISSPTEHAALRPPPGIVADTLDTIHRLHRIRSDVDAVLHRLSAWRSDRAHEQCAEGHVLPRGVTRCQWIDPDTGQQCATRAATERRCINCQEVQLPGQPLRQGRCDPCRQTKRRTGRERVATSALALDAGLIRDDGTYTTDE